jgi:hypothetical protein
MGWVASLCVHLLCECFFPGKFAKKYSNTSHANVLVIVTVTEVCSPT